MSTSRIAVQVDAEPLADEGVERVLDAIQRSTDADTVFLTGFTMSRESGGGVAPGHPFPDHGRNEHRIDWTGGNYAAMSPERYRSTLLGPAGRAETLPDFDIFAATIPPCRARGMQVYDFIDESAHAPALREIPGILDCLEVDIWNKPARRPCFNNPDYRNWHLAIVADHVLSHDLDGICWQSQRISPLDRLLVEPTPQGMGLAVCWCAHCLAKASNRGLNWRRAQEGYRKLVALNVAAASGELPTDGVFASFWRLLINYPEIFGWQSLWLDGKVQMYRDVFGTVRAIRPSMKVGFTMPQLLSFSPFFRASQDFSELSHICDYVLLSCHTGIGGARLRGTIARMCHSIFGATEPDQLYSVLRGLMGLDTTPLEKLPAAGLSPAHIGTEVRRVHLGGEGRCEVWAGIDVDVPETGTDSSYHDSPLIDLGDGELGGRRDWDPGPTVRAALDAGAAGIVFGRKYSEMRLSVLARTRGVLGNAQNK